MLNTSSVFFRVPPFARTLLLSVLAVWGVLLAARAVMLVLLWPEVSRADAWSDILYALYIGAKFDARMAVFGSLPLALVLGIPWLERRLAALRLWLDAFYGLVFWGVAFLYAVDFGFFFYLRRRLDATVFEFLGDLGIAADMVRQSYPVFRIALGLIIVALGAAYVTDRLLRAHLRAVVRYYRESPRRTWKPRAAWSLGVFVLLFFMGYGQISADFFPLRWSNAFFSPDRNLAVLALNPIQNLRDTVVINRSTLPDLEAVREAYPRMARWLRVDRPDAEKLDYWRVTPAGNPDRRWNVVVILMESFSWPMTSFAPGPDDPTPNARQLAAESLSFPWFFAPSRTTARAIFTSLTGIPDVNRSGGTSSRNQALVDQFLLLNEFKGYQKYYFIGGSASWANIRGVLRHNVDGLRLMEEGEWKAPKVDVWGISDLSLFRESVAVLSESPLPFTAFIQTAGFHRPWTIPDDNAGFALRDPGPDVIRRYGFENAAEYNSLRFSDHALGEFFRLARQQPWFKNTIFAVMGDHGLNNVPGNMPPGYTACRLQGSHIPLLLYAPDLIRPGVAPFPCGQPDVYPTLAALAGIPFRNHTLGRNLLDPATAADARQFIAGENEHSWRLVEDGYCYQKEETEALYNLNSPELKNVLEEEPERADRMRRDAAAFFHTSKYLLFNNHKEAAPSAPRTEEK